MIDEDTTKKIIRINPSKRFSVLALMAILIALFLLVLGTIWLSPPSRRPLPGSLETVPSVPVSSEPRPAAVVPSKRMPSEPRPAARMPAERAHPKRMSLPPSSVWPLLSDESDDPNKSADAPHRMRRRIKKTAQEPSDPDENPQAPPAPGESPQAPPAERGERAAFLDQETRSRAPIPQPDKLTQDEIDKLLGGEAPPSKARAPKKAAKLKSNHATF